LGEETRDTVSAAAIWPLEQALVEANVHQILPDWDERSRAAVLLEDLADLGIALPIVRPLSVGGEAYQYGVIYVLEGSRLGARVLTQWLLTSSDLSAGRAFRYLRHGEGRPLWRRFLERLESSEAVRHSPADAIAGAHAAFEWFGAKAARSSYAGAGERHDPTFG
jgi:heme oxygenase